MIRFPLNHKWLDNCKWIHANIKALFKVTFGLYGFALTLGEHCGV